MNVPIGIVALVLAVRLLPGTARDRDHRLDVPGFFLLAPGLALLVYGLSEVGTTGGFTASSVRVSLVAGAVLTVAFVLRSLRAAEPLVDMRLFRRRNFSVATVAIFLTGATLYGTMFLLPLYYQIVRGQSPWMAGLLMAPQGIGAALVMRPAAQLADRFGTRRTVPVGMVLLAVGTLAYTQVSATTSYGVLAVALFVRGIGLGFGMMPVFAASYRGLTHAEIPRATTATNIVRQVGGSLGVALFAVVLQQAITRQFPGSDTTLGSVSAGHLSATEAGRLAAAFGTSFWWSFGVCVLAIVPSFFLPGRLPAEPGVVAEIVDAEEASAEDIAGATTE